jgi:hypothetical protein
VSRPLSQAFTCKNPNNVDANSGEARRLGAWRGKSHSHSENARGAFNADRAHKLLRD